MLFSILFIVLVVIVVGMLLFFGRSRKTSTHRSDLKKEEKPFVFSNDKPFVAARKPIDPASKTAEAPRPQIVKKEKPSPSPQKAIPPENQTQEPPKQASLPKTAATKEEPSQNIPPQANQNGLDFDHLSDLIEDFFSEEKNPKDFE